MLQHLDLNKQQNFPRKSFKQDFSINISPLLKIAKVDLAHQLHIAQLNT